MARASGALAVGVLTGSGEREQLLETGAVCVLPNIGHLKDLLQLSQGHSSQVEDLNLCKLPSMAQENTPPIQMKKV